MSNGPKVPGDTPEATPARKDAIAWLEERLNLTELFSFITHFGIIYAPIDTQRPLREQWKKIVETPMVSYARWPHILGLLTALLFALEAFTGVLLAFYHQPTIAGA